MKLRSVLQFSTVAMALVSGTALVAQVTTGALSGTVRDNKGRPVANARVSLSSPALFNPRVIMTDANGEWHAPLLPIGNYRVQVSLSGYVGSEARDVRVGIGSTVRQDLNLKPISVSEKTVEVVAEAGEVDKAATSTATNFSAEVLETMAGSDRSFNGAADLSPGVATASNGQFTVRGGQTQNTLFRVNGSDVKDDYQGGLTSTWVIEDNIEDVQVVLSPLNARNGRAISGQVNVVTKTGGNDFAGSIRAVVNRPSWAAMTPYSQNLPGQVSDNLSRQFDVTFSGPIVKDRLWFSFGTILTPSSSTSYQIPAASSLAKQSERSGIPAIDNQFDGLTPTNVPAGYSFASGLLGIQPYTQVYNANYYEGKITGAISQDHTLEASFTYSSDSIAGRDPYGDGNSILRRLQQLGTQTDKAHQYGLHYSGVFNSTTFLEAKYNRFLSQAIYPQGDPNFKSDAVDLWLDTPNGAGHNWTDVGYPFGLGITPRPDARNNESWNINLKLFRGSGSAQHEIDLGVESYMSDRDTSRSQGQDNAYFRVGGAFYNPNASGQSAWLFPVIPWQGPRVNGQSGSGNSGLAPILEQFLGKDGTTKTITRSLYANDNITFNSHWNMMVGLRFDQITVDDTTGAQLAKNSDFSPRFQLRYDVDGTSKHLFTFTAAEFGGDFTTGFTDAFIQKADSKAVYYGYQGPAGSALANGANPASALQWITYAQLTDPANYTGTNYAGWAGHTNTAYNFADNSKTYIIDGKLRAPMMDEATMTYRRNYAGGSFLRMTYVYRTWKDSWAFKTDYDAADMVTVSDPSNSGLASKQIPAIHVFNSNALTRQYQGLELEWSQRLSAIWTMVGNYTYSRLTGNDNGGDSSTSSFRDNGVPGYYGNRTWLLANGLTDKDFAPTGPLLVDQTHRARLSFTANVPMGKGMISYSFLMRYDSGNNWSAVYGAPIGIAGIPGANTPPATYQQYYGGRGQYTYNDTYQCDFKLAYHVPLGLGRLQLIGDLKINNLFNTMLQATYSTQFWPNGNGQNALYLWQDKTPGGGGFGTADPTVGNYWIAGRNVATTIGLRF